MPAASDPVAASRLVAALELAWGAIRTRHPEVPDAVLVVASGSDPRSRALTLGHFAAGRWRLADDTQRPEVLVSGEGLRRGPADVLGTLLHEAAHGLAHARRIKDTSRQGRYHNKRYAALAEELGIAVAHVEPIGWSATSVPAATAADYRPTLEQLETALVLWRHAERPGYAVRPPSTVACACACGRRIRLSRSTLEQAPILCGACIEPFTPERALTRERQPAPGRRPHPSRPGDRSSRGRGDDHDRER
jgi:hypothetical protein